MSPSRVAMSDSGAGSAYHELCAYTLAHRDPRFVHQHVVDAAAAQEADERTKPITLTFALAGLYLHVERGFTGRQVQRVHTLLAARGRTWPRCPLPEHRGALGAADVLAAPAGAERDAAIDAWCRAVWDAYAGCRPTLVDLLRRYDIG